MAGELAEKPRADYADVFPVLLTVVRSDTPGQAVIVGHIIMAEGEAGSLKAAVDLWAQIPMLAEKYLLVWEGWQPPRRRRSPKGMGRAYDLPGARGACGAPGGLVSHLDAREAGAAGGGGGVRPAGQGGRVSWRVLVFRIGLAGWILLMLAWRMGYVHPLAWCGQ